MTAEDQTKITDAIVDTDEKESASETNQPPEKKSTGAHAKRKRVRRWPRVLLVVVGVVLLIGIIIAAAIGNYLNSGKDDLLADSEQTILRKTIKHDGVNYALNENMITVAILGTDRGTGSTFKDSNGTADAIMLLAYDTATSKITLINVPRNMQTDIVYVYTDGKEYTLNTFVSTAYSYGNSDAEGAEFVCRSLENLLEGLQVRDYVAMLERCIEPLTEVIGGVTLTAVGSVPYMGIQEGETYTLQGEMALRYVQYRDTSSMTSPADRIERQKDFITHFVPQAIDAVKKDPGIIEKFYDIITDPKYMTTNLQTNELAYLASTVMLNGIRDMEILTLPYDSEYFPESTLLMYYPREDEITDILIDVYYKPVE